MNRTTLKTSWKIETAAPRAKSIAFVVYFSTSWPLMFVGEVLALLADVHPLEVMRVEPELEAVDVLLEPGLGALSVLARKVGVDPICRRLRLVADDHADGDGDDGQRSGKAEVDDRNREAARNPEPFQGAHQRVEQ